MIKDLYELFTFEPLHSLHVVVTKLFKNSLKHYLSCGDIYSHPARPSEKQKRQRLLEISLRSPCNGILVHFEDKYLLQEPHVSFATRE